MATKQFPDSGTTIGNKMNLSTNPRTTNNIKCYHCGKKYLTNATFKVHLKTHDKHRSTFKCSVDGCVREFKKKSTLNDHIQKVHLGTFKRIGCSLCDSTFMVNLDYILITK